MTETEIKARDLVDKYKSELIFLMYFSYYHDTCKQCALIAVQNTIDGIKLIIGDQSHMWTSHQIEVVNSYKAMQAEIEKL